MKIIKTIIDVIKVTAFMILPFIIYSLMMKALENVSGETVVQAMIIGNTVFVIYLKIKIMKGGK